jgi:hypothetical protein
MKSIKPMAAQMKPSVAANKTEVVGLANTSTAAPTNVTNSDINAALVGHDVQSGLEKVTIGVTAVSAPAPNRNRIGSAAERRNSEIAASGGSAGALSDIGDTATAMPKR